MRSVLLIGLLAAAGALAVGCMTPTYTEDDSHPTTSTTKSTPLPNATTTAATTTQLPPVVASSSGSTPSTTSAPPATPGAGGSADAGTKTSDGGTITPGTMSPSGYVQNASRAKQTGACAQSDIGYYEGLLNAKGQTYGDMKKEMQERDPKCATCMFTDYASSQWGPVVMEDATGGFFNWASCYALAPGGNDKCGNEVQQYFDCLDDVCAAYTDDTDYTNCQNIAAADTTSCGGLKFTDCADLDALNTSCATYESALGFACGN